MGVSALELIEQLRTLPAREQADFARLFRQMQEQSPGAASATAQAASPRQWPEFAARLRRIYGDRVVPGSQTLVSYGRGDR
jgi:hypothetical protein